MAEENEEIPMGHFEERPIECSECKKAIAVRYTEVVGKDVTHTIMCADCPQLQHRLHGLSVSAEREERGVTALGLSCGECGTTFESVKMGNPVGCSNCYEVFEDALLLELQVSKKVSRQVEPRKRSAPIHIGRTPGESKELSPSLQLLALNEALTETLSREDYEQAAWLRDQIQAIKDTEHEEN